ncbi:50S ribosomal protein L5 [Candidatus Peribacteria bacterium RIFCSPLOWO2_01_FULL_51_18]|nr:MAG: 50S ribosomal protein L5 [Candidatus Peribacteria bacterium RIFCSPLOWO2_01_FULL_51_18]
MAFVPLQKRLKTDIAKALKEELKVTNDHALPQVKKVILNVGLNQKKYSSKDIQQYIADSIALIAGQRPSSRKSRKAISNFNIRQNMIIGLRVTLRGKRMYAFLDRLLCYALPRIRDFRGLTPKLDGQGNFAIGIQDHSVFPEVPSPEASKIFGMQIQVTTSARTDARGMALFRQMGFPFRRPQKKGSKETEVS